MGKGETHSDLEHRNLLSYETLLNLFKDENVFATFWNDATHKRDFPFIRLIALSYGGLMATSVSAEQEFSGSSSIQGSLGVCPSGYNFESVQMCKVNEEKNVPATKQTFTLYEAPTQKRHITKRKTKNKEGRREPAPDSS